VECTTAEAAELVIAISGLEFRAVVADQNLDGDMLGSELAELLPTGKARDQLLRKARANETAAYIDEWISSPGLRPPGSMSGAAHKVPRRTG
jgi:hypothetical protein